MQLNHALIMASDINEMSLFLTHALGLTEGSRPPFGFLGVWLYDQKNVPCIHIASRHDITSSQSFYLSQMQGTQAGLPTIDHLAFVSDDYIGLKQRLMKFGVPFIEREIPEVNEHQVFITGPDNLKIEILFSRNVIN